MYKLAVGFSPKPIFRHKIRLLAFRAKDIIAGEKFNAQFTVRNTGGNDFPGGKIDFHYKSPVHVHDCTVTIPLIPGGEQKSTSHVSLKAAGSGDAFIKCNVKASDGQTADCGEFDNPIAQLIGYELRADGTQDPSKPQCVFRVTSREDIGSRRRQIIIILISAAALIVSLLLLL